MAINENNALDPLHCCFVAGTGGGKTIGLKKIGLWPKRGCIAMFDPYGDFHYRRGDPLSGLGGLKVHHYSTRAAFAKAFLSAWRSRKPFRLAYKPPGGTDRNEMLWFADLMWKASDGKRRLDVIIEELAKMVVSNGKEEGPVGEIATGGRKFGLVLHTLFQRPQEVPKTIWNQSPYKIIGAQEARKDAKYVAEEIDQSIEAILNLSALNSKARARGLKQFHFLIKSPGYGNVKPRNFKI